MGEVLYHGSSFKVEKPKILTSGFYKDFGYGFYCTNIEKQAKRWAIVKGKRHVVNVYSYEENKELNILNFNDMTEEWLDFVINCRRGIEHSYDIVSGPMADDTIWDYIEDYIEGKITREAFWVLVKFKYPTHQSVFATEQALRCLTFERSYEL